MLRAVGVPTRVVNGFKGADYNSAGGYYQVRQLLAHAWVQAYVESERYWMNLDPTPGEGREQNVRQHRSSFQWAYEWVDAVTNAWAGYIVGYSDSEQKKLFYVLLQDMWNSLLERVRAFVQQVIETARRMTTMEFWLSRQGALAALGLACLALAGTSAPRLGPRWRIGRWLPGWRDGRMSLAWPLYDEWVRALERRGWVRPAASTPREFAVRLRSDWSKQPNMRPWVDLPERMVDLFYQARFGGREPGPQDSADLQIRLKGFVQGRSPKLD
jgi:hypothetical protein